MSRKNKHGDPYIGLLQKYEAAQERIAVLESLCKERGIDTPCMLGSETIIVQDWTP